eukprot:CAMPEP_0194194002 /NCGR_PEP_ID=MMETSP0154-20130528/75342_1 /TAXON_ID=1049557 /ORGANISM="Thalassiothrix antarctica, Strain L6-D1" /LENGTH=233 /DNA_ID=CAMNT_0038918387 /DNA_START=129 /DNA_END=830 /DNA_ORIENTATION=+
MKKSIVRKLEDVKEILDGVDPTEVMHLKGFGSGIESTEYDDQILEMLSGYKVIEWDGDDYNNDSFTRLLPLAKAKYPKCRFVSGYNVIEWDGDDYNNDSFTRLLPLAMAKYPKCRFVAFKFLSDTQKGWPGNSNFPDDFDFDVVGVDNTGKTDESGGVDYAYLGIEAINATGATKTICLGGGGVPKQEFDRGPSSVEWTLVPYTRLVNNSVQEASLMEYVEAQPRVTLLEQKK